MVHSTSPIGVFDSGVGGLGVLDTLAAALPEEDFVYFGDTIHMPYGDKTLDQVSGYVGRILDWLYTERQMKLLVMACNTASVVLLRQMTEIPPVPWVDTIQPICRWLAQESGFQTVGLMATPATIRSNQYQRTLLELNPQMSMIPAVCEGLASLIEAGQMDSLETQSVLQHCIKPLQMTSPEAVILGCTHYPHARHLIARQLPGPALLDPAGFICRQVQTLLDERHLRASQAQSGTVEYFVSGDAEQFYRAIQTLPLTALPLKKPASEPLFGTSRL